MDGMYSTSQTRVQRGACLRNTVDDIRVWVIQLGAVEQWRENQLNCTQITTLDVPERETERERVVYCRRYTYWLVHSDQPNTIT